MFIHTTHDLCTSLLPDVALYSVFYYLLPVKFRALFFQKTPQLIIALLPLSLSLSLNFSFSHSLSHSLPVFRAPPFLLPPPIRSIVSQKPGIARSRSILLDSFVAFSSQSPTILLNRDIFSPRSSFQASNLLASLRCILPSSFFLFRLFIFLYRDFSDPLV